MKLDSGEKIILIETRRFFGAIIGFPFRRGGFMCKIIFRGLIDIYLTNRRIYVELPFKFKILEVLLSNISYFKKEKKFGSRIRIGYIENVEEKEVILIMREKDMDNWVEELNKLINFKYTGSNIVP